MANKKRNKTIVIHSKVSYGYVGSSTTALVLQIGGHDAITVPTVLYSNRLGLPTVGGGAIPPALFADILKGILELNILDEVAAIFTGFIGSSDLVRITADFIKEIKQHSPEITYLCDPIMGDINDGFYVPADVPEAIVKHLVPMADLLTPNQFECQYLLGGSLSSPAEAAKRARETVSDSQKIVATGCHFPTTPEQAIDTVVLTSSETEVVRTKRIPVYPPGSGELFAAHMYLHMLNGGSLINATQHSGIVLQEVLSKMHQEQKTEFELSDILFSFGIENGLKSSI
ncbi:pyridoxal kinase [Chitinophaga silvatica]|uniref:pyridoxal kinase n=1 Tax=Chitinophaga silvatica TaxID=2282649 RepID=A0A3E1Y5W6_9BACT|nr:pyridoxal kinase [Chitinophaga silvatica]RFS20140.1 pyridoxal kinase [Chitinophaga silvatica]